jgi:hypothetical protein
VPGAADPTGQGSTACNPTEAGCVLEFTIGILKPSHCVMGERLTFFPPDPAGHVIDLAGRLIRPGNGREHSTLMKRIRRWFRDSWACAAFPSFGMSVGEAGPRKVILVVKEVDVSRFEKMVLVLLTTRK